MLFQDESCIGGLVLFLSNPDNQLVKLSLEVRNVHILALNSNTLVICNHGSSTPGGGREIAVEMSSAFTFALCPQCGQNTRDRFLC